MRAAAAVAATGILAAREDTTAGSNAVLIGRGAFASETAMMTAACWAGGLAALWAALALGAA